MSTPTFIPATDDLRTVVRDLRFHPSTTAHPREFSTSQIETFNREGYLTGIRVFNEREIGNIRSYFDELLARTLAEGGNSYSISTAHLRHGRVYDLLTNPKIVSYVKDLLGGRRFSCRTALGHVVFVREKGLEFRAVPEAIDITNGRD